MQKTIVQRLGILAGKPATSSLHRHAVKIAGQDDEEILLINSEENKKILGGTIYDPSFQLRQSCRPLWHCDISYEPVPSDYCLLRLTEVPESGGGMQTPNQGYRSHFDIRHLKPKSFALQILFGLLDMSSTIVYRNLSNLCSRHCQPRTKNCESETRRTPASRSREAAPRTSAPISTPSTRSSVRTRSRGGRASTVSASTSSTSTTSRPRRATG